jgi:hypothetical protein
VLLANLGYFQPYAPKGLDKLDRKYYADLPVELVRRLGVEEGRMLVARLPPERIRVYPAGALPG